MVIVLISTLNKIMNTEKLKSDKEKTVYDRLNNLHELQIQSFQDICELKNKLLQIADDPDSHPLSFDAELAKNQHEKFLYSGLMERIMMLEDAATAINKAIDNVIIFANKKI